MRLTDRQTAIHEAGHAVVGHLVGVAIDHVTIIPKGFVAGYSRPVRRPVATTADKLWAESVAISRRLVWGRLSGGFDGKEGYLLRKGSRRRHWKFNGRAVRPSRDGCGMVTIHGTPAPKELVDRMEGLRKRANAMWKKDHASKSRDDHVKDLMHTLGGPVADTVFFNVPFEAPRSRLLTKAELKELRMERSYGTVGKTIGNGGAGGDFRMIRAALKYIDDANWKDAREVYRRKAEKLVRQHRTTIERVAKALLRHKTLSGVELAKLIKGAAA